MKEKFDKLYAKEAEYINVSAQAEAIHKTRLEKEKEAKKYIGWEKC